jgi:predicted TIM-barrel fold metal-dependent hydrolase
MSVIYNCHTHVFTNRNVPNGFLPLRLLVLLRRKPVARFVSRVLRRILPLTNSDRLDRVAVFLDVGSKDSQEDILKYILQFYPDDTKIVALSVDMDHMGAGKAPQGYLNQLEELAELKKNPEYADTLIPFIAADPRRDNLAQLVTDYIDNHGFGGIKLYPPLGYFPFDARFDELFRVAEDRQIPIITHCSRGGICTREKITEEMRIHPKTKKKLKGRSNATFTDNYTDPENYKWVLEKFNDLKICFAHFGGDVEWRKYLDDPWPSETTEKSWLSTIADHAMILRCYRCSKS